jgi:hypothetical protein
MGKETLKVEPSSREVELVAMVRYVAAGEYWVGFRAN